MKIINKPRCSGKTIELIHTSEATGARMVVCNKVQAENIRRKAKELECNIPMPLTVKEAKEGKESNKSKPYLIDDLDCCLEEILEDYFGRKVVAVTMGIEQE